MIRKKTSSQRLSKSKAENKEEEKKPRSLEDSALGGVHTLGESQEQRMGLPSLRKTIAHITNHKRYPENAVIDCTVLEARSVPARKPCVVLSVEGNTFKTPALEGPDPLWNVRAASDAEPYPNKNHFSIPVRDVVQAMVHVMLYDGEEEVELVGCGIIPVCRLFRMGRSLGEITAWVALFSPEVIYFPTAEIYEHVHYLLAPSQRTKKVEGRAKLFGFVELRLKLEEKTSILKTIAFAPPLKDHIPPEIQHRLDAADEYDAIFDLTARASLLANTVSSMDKIKGSLVLASLPFWWHICFWAPFWEWPLLIFVVSALALTFKDVFSRKGSDGQYFISENDRVKSSDIGVQTTSVRKLLVFIGRTISLILPFAEKIQNAFVIQDLALIFVTLSVVWGILLAVFIYLFPDDWVVFVVGLLFLIPLNVVVLTEVMLGKAVNVYEISFLEARDLEACDLGGTSDPYCKIDEEEMLDLSGEKIKTTTKKKTLNPKWKESFKISVSRRFEYGVEPITVLLYDENIGQKNELMGRVEVRKEDFLYDDVKWFDVLDASKGELLLGFKYVGQTFESFKKSDNPFWDKWPLMSKVKREKKGRVYLLSRLTKKFYFSKDSWQTSQRYFLFWCFKDCNFKNANLYCCFKNKNISFDVVRGH